MILAHHGYGEELIVYALAGGGAGSGLLLVLRAEVGRLIQWLRRR